MVAATATDAVVPVLLSTLLLLLLSSKDNAVVLDVTNCWTVLGDDTALLLLLLEATDWDVEVMALVDGIIACCVVSLFCRDDSDSVRNVVNKVPLEIICVLGAVVDDDDDVALSLAAVADTDATADVISALLTFAGVVSDTVSASTDAATVNVPLSPGTENDIAVGNPPLTSPTPLAVEDTAPCDVMLLSNNDVIICVLLAVTVVVELTGVGVNGSLKSDVVSFEGPSGRPCCPVVAAECVNVELVRPVTSAVDSAEKYVIVCLLVDGSDTLDAAVTFSLNKLTVEVD